MQMCKPFSISLSGSAEPIVCPLTHRHKFTHKHAEIHIGSRTQGQCRAQAPHTAGPWRVQTKTCTTIKCSALQNVGKYFSGNKVREAELVAQLQKWTANLERQIKTMAKTVQCIMKWGQWKARTFFHFFLFFHFDMRRNYVLCMFSPHCNLQGHAASKLRKACRVLTRKLQHNLVKQIVRYLNRPLHWHWFRQCACMCVCVGGRVVGGLHIS